jgi:hypothetical protein
MEHLWENDQPDRCEHCGAGDDAHHSYTCPTGKHPDREFQPEYFSGLNWREAEKLVGKVVEFTDDPDDIEWEQGVLAGLDMEVPGRRFSIKRDDNFEYIRTCPETYQDTHPTITITVNGKDFKLPRPEVEAPGPGQKYFYVGADGNIVRCSWDGYGSEHDILALGKVHLTEARAQAWADWWRDYIMAAARGDEWNDSQKKYHELLMAVESKYPGETRHETALRYIMEREGRACGVSKERGVRDED